jgi:hypothetical protein
VQKKLFLHQTRTPDRKYAPDIRSFALTLHFYSSSAYNYVRKTFNNCLPHPSTLRKWVSTVDGSAGFTKEAFEILNAKGGEFKAQNKVLVCGLIYDEMSIRKYVEWTGKRYFGYVDFGGDIESDALPEAKEALVFLLVALNCRWKLPVGYFLLNGLKASEKANLILECLRRIGQCDNIKVSSLTFDGTATNFSVATQLGARLLYTELKPWFLHPVTNERVHIILDPCHMVKLLRNTLADWHILVDEDGRKIKWEFFKTLVDLQQTEGLHAANKLTQRHINFKQEIMKVRLAVQIFSRSVAAALDFCNKDLNLKSFADSEGTSNFCRKLNDIFDALNSRNLLSKSSWGKPLTLENITSFTTFFESSIQYISTLHTPDGQNILMTRRRTGFIGLIICLTSVQNMVDDLIKTKLLDYILTYKVSQDHIEMFFSAIRSRGGYNNNPTAKQFEGAYKRLLLKTEISTSVSANCVQIDNTSILTISSRCRKEQHVDDLLDLIDDNEEHVTENEDVLNFPNWSPYLIDITKYISGFVARKIAKSVKCSICADAVFASETNSKLLIRKNRGGLLHASRDVIKICQIAENVFRFFIQSTPHPVVNKMVISGLRKISNSYNPFASLNSHILNQDPINNHILQLTSLVLRVYFTIRVHHQNSHINQIKTRVRQLYTNLV